MFKYLEGGTIGCSPSLRFQDMRKEDNVARMELMTQEIEQKFHDLGCQEGLGRSAVIVLKVFNPCGQQTWYFTEYDPENRLLFGFASLFGDCNDEWGYTSLDELESVRLPFGLHLERDLHFGYPKAGEVGPICKKMEWSMPDHPVS